MRVPRQVVEQRRGFVEKQRQVILDPGGGNAAGQVLKDRAATEVDIEPLAKARLETGHGVFLQRELAGRQQAHRLHFIDGSLGLRVEGAQGLDFIVEQVDPVRQFAAHREQVDQRTAHGELAMLIHRVNAAITAGLKARAHLFDIKLLPHVQHQAAAQQELGRRQAM